MRTISGIYLLVLDSVASAGKNKIMTLLCTLFLTACSATMIQSPHSAYGPTDGKRIGKIVYDERLVEQREDAYQQMYSACNGNYKILNEVTKELNQKTEYEAYATPAKKFKAQKTQSSDPYVTITFECQ